MRLGTSMLMVAFLVSAGCKSRDTGNYSKMHSEAGIKRPKFSEVHKDLLQIEKKYASRATLMTYGQSSGGRPLLALKLEDRDFKTKKSRKAVVITEAIHGNEYLHITDQLAPEFAKRSGESSPLKSFLAEGGIIYLIPVYNPDGFIAGIRENSNHVDLNRDFTIPSLGNEGFKQVETKSFVNLIHSEAKKEKFSLEFFMEYHCCIGGLIHPWAHTEKPIAKQQLAALEEIGEISKKTLGYPYGNAHEIVNYNATGASIDYIQETFMRRAFSLEGKYETEDKNFRKHVTMYEEIFSRI